MQRGPYFTAVLALVAIGTQPSVAGPVTGAGAPVTDRSLSLNVYGASLGQLASLSRGIDGGVRLPDGSAIFDHSFVVPVDHAPGTPIGLRLLWHSLEPSCFVDLRGDFISVARAGSTPIEAELEINGGVPIFTPLTPSETVETIVLLPELLALQQNDAVTFGIFRAHTANDSCTEDVILRGMSVIYLGIQVFGDGFASGDTSAWSDSVP